MYLLLTLTFLFFCLPALAKPVQYISKYKNDTEVVKIDPNSHFDYANPNAPKGGELVMATLGSFDSLNRFTVLGKSAARLDLMYARLTKKRYDISGYYHGLIAKTIDLSYQDKYITFTIRPEAKFSDGTPITAEDVAFSFVTLRDKGVSFYRNYYSQIKKYIIKDKLTIQFIFNEDAGNSAYFALCDMSILSKNFWRGRDFKQTLTKIPIVSGPYKIKEFKFGKYITYERVKNWWGENVPATKGHYNFDIIKYKYYKDSTVLKEAFKAGEYDIRYETVSKSWYKDYNFDAVKKGLVKLKEFTYYYPIGMKGFVFNTRRKIFKDIKVREALTYVFDFDRLNNVLSSGKLIRSKSYFNNSELGATGTPSPEELKLLLPFKDQLDPRIFTQEYIPPSTLKPNSLRKNLQTAINLFAKAGWSINNQGIMVNNKTNKPFEFTILEKTEKTSTMLFISNLKRIGINAKIKRVNASQYYWYRTKFNYDMVINYWAISAAPSTELINKFGSKSANQNASSNYSGIQSPAADAMIEKIISAKTRKELIIATNALDRILRWSIIVIPRVYFSGLFTAYWDKIAMPKKLDYLYSPDSDTFWSKEAELKQNKKQ